jgi:sugar lactone lactonase YvrE/quinol monooxygenase YgiN
MADDIRCVAPVGDICGEGVVWHPEHQAIYWTDINRFLIHRMNLEDESTRTWIFREPVTALNLTTDPDRLLVVFASCVALWSPRSHPRVDNIFHLPTAPQMRLNDARVDPRGSLWAGTMRNNVGPQGEDLNVTFADGVLYRIDPDGFSSEWKRGIGISNTVAWSPDGATFYFGDSMANAIYRFRFDSETGKIEGETPFLVGYERGLPDGSVVDAAGFLWNTRPSAGCLIRISPEGHVCRIVSLPIAKPTTCIFGGTDLKTLYVTSARSSEQLSGSLFALQTDVGGLPPGRFRLL